MLSVKDKIINFRPVAFISVFFIIGVLFRYFSLHFKVAFLLFSIAIILLAVIFKLFFYKNVNRLVYFTFSCIFLISYFAGGGVMAEKLNENLRCEEINNAYFNGKIVNVSVLDETFDYKYTIYVKGMAENKNITALVHTKEQYFIGDNIQFIANFKPFFCLNENGVNNTPLYMNVNYKTKDVKLLSYSNKSPNIIQKTRITFRKAVLNNSESSVSGLIYAVLTGDESASNFKQLQIYRNLGVSHIFAVSGLHIGIIFSLFLFLGKLFKISKKNSFYFTAIIVFFYSLICGLTPSVIRAYIIVVISYFVLFSGFKPDFITSLTFSATVVLIINPTDILSAGFVLSYGVYFFIVVFAPKIKILLNKLLPEKVSVFLSPYISAVIPSTVLGVMFFNKIPLFAIIFNIFLVPIMPVLFSFSLFGVFLTIIFNVKRIFLIPSNVLFLLIDNISAKINLLPFININFSGGIWILFFFLSFILLSGFINVSKKNKMIYTISCFSLTLFSLIAELIF